MASMNGTVKRLVSDKGFGFIVADDGNEYFFHNSACGNVRFDDLREGRAVAFERGQGPKGPRAKTSGLSEGRRWLVVEDDGGSAWLTLRPCL
jgi:CspA family cold shock protein